jgi:hypothetical protein
MKIDCAECEMYRSEHCADCLVTAVLHPPTGAVEIDEELDSSLRTLSGAGLIPVLKFRPRTDGEPPAGEVKSDDGEARAG